MISKTIFGRLVAKESGLYTTYVFHDVCNNEYIMCVRLPNWECGEIELNEKGYVKVNYVYPGDVYLDSEMNQQQYRFEQIYFDSFVKLKNKQEIKL